MEHRSLLGEIDLLPPEHRVDSRLQAGLLGQLKQELQGLVSHAILGIVQIEAHSLDRHPLAALRIFCEQLSQMDR